jgi:hypothetical protein
MDSTFFWIVAACACIVVGIYFFFVRGRQPESPTTPPQEQ